MLVGGLAAAVLLGKSREPTGSSDEPQERHATVRQALHVGPATVIVELARTPEEWARGLSERNSLPQEGGMLFVFPTAEPRTFWMKDTRISLDMIWVRDGKVIGITVDVPPERGVVDAVLRRYPSPGGVDHVLEVNAGWAAEHDVKIGDAVTLSGL